MRYLKLKTVVVKTLFQRQDWRGKRFEKFLLQCVEDRGMPIGFPVGTMSRKRQRGAYDSLARLFIKGDVTDEVRSWHTTGIRCDDSSFLCAGPRRGNVLLTRRIADIIKRSFVGDGLRLFENWSNFYHIGPESGVHAVEQNTGWGEAVIEE